MTPPVAFSKSAATRAKVAAARAGAAAVGERGQGHGVGGHQARDVVRPRRCRPPVLAGKDLVSRPSMNRLQATGAPATSVLEFVSRAGSSLSSGWAALKEIGRAHVELQSLTRI